MIPQKDIDLDQLHSALSFIPSDDRQTWLNIGNALKFALGPDGFSVWDYWSESAHNYSAEACISVWRSFREQKFGIGVVFHIAKLNGWTPDRKMERPVIKPKPAPKSQSSTKQYALELWLRSERSDTAVGRHPYAEAKGITWAAGAGRVRASGKIIGKDSDCIIVPIRDLETFKVVAVQCINPQGDKQTFGAISGNAFICGNTLDKSLRWFVCEGSAVAVLPVVHHCK